MDEKNIILVKEVRQGESYGELDKTANTILDMMNTEAMTNGSRILWYGDQ